VPLPPKVIPFIKPDFKCMEIANYDEIIPLKRGQFLNAGLSY
jgi:hypothetical protein